MNLTKKERQFVEDEKANCKRGWESMMRGRTRFEGDGLDEEYKTWGTWRLIEIIEKLDGRTK